MTTTVIHKRDIKPGDIYIGRPGKWGNPFVIGRDGDRTEVIRKYEMWFAHQDKLIESLNEIQNKRLVCWCKPYACHGDVLARWADNLGNLEKN